jgi:hypothetical protein
MFSPQVNAFALRIVLVLKNARIQKANINSIIQRKSGGLRPEKNKDREGPWARGIGKTQLKCNRNSAGLQAIFRNLK